MSMIIGYLEVVEVKKIRSRSVCQLIVEADISQFKALVQLDDTKGVFIPCNIDGAVCGAREMDFDVKEIEDLMGLSTAQVEGPEPEEKPDPGEKSFAQKMAIDGYFRNPKVWAGMEADGVYTQERHYEAVKKLKPIWIFPKAPREGDIVAHHVRTSENSGTGIKPKHWFCIPLHNSQHQMLHDKGISREVKERLLEQAIEITAKAMRGAFKGRFALITLSGYTREDLIAAEKAMGYCSGYVGNW